MGLGCPCSYFSSEMSSVMLPCHVAGTGLYEHCTLVLDCHAASLSKSWQLWPSRDGRLSCNPCLSSRLTPRDATAALALFLLLEESVAFFRIWPLDTGSKYRFHNQHQTASEKHEGAQQGLPSCGPHTSFLCAMCLFSSAFLITVSDFKFTNSHQPSFPSSRLILFLKEPMCPQLLESRDQFCFFFFPFCPKFSLLPIPTCTSHKSHEINERREGWGTSNVSELQMGDNSDPVLPSFPFLMWLRAL